ncbi:MAG: hypothetical protein M0R74_17675 [Dehalococcoidia bacterium]|nr:hypothetical protein [Dehalococcoidia bacterium]
MVKLTPKMPKATKGDMIDVAGMAVVKTVVEAMSAPYLGDGSLRSGAMKVGAGYAIDKFIGGRYARLLAGGLIFDGVEDGLVSTGIIGMAGSLGGSLGGVGRGVQQAEDW